MQHTHYSTDFTKRSFPIVLICDGVKSPANIGSIFRISEAFGIEQIFFGNANPDFNSARMKRTARNTIDKIRYEVTDDLNTTIKLLKNKGYQLIALEITGSSGPLRQLQLQTDSKTVLVVGNEAHGISQTVLDLMDHTYHIDLYGENSSINVAMAVAIAFYELTGPK